MGVVIFVLSVMRIVGGVLSWVICVFRHVDFVYVGLVISGIGIDPNDGPSRSASKLGSNVFWSRLMKEVLVEETKYIARRMRDPVLVEVGGLLSNG